MMRRSTTIPDSYFEVLPGRVSGLVQYVVIGCILREMPGISGWTHSITVEEFAGFAGATTRAVQFALADALERGLIERRKLGRYFCYRARADAWAKIPEYKLAVHEGVA